MSSVQSESRAAHGSENLFAYKPEASLPTRAPSRRGNGHRGIRWDIGGYTFVSWPATTTCLRPGGRRPGSACVGKDAAHTDRRSDVSGLIPVTRCTARNSQNANKRASTGGLRTAATCTLLAAPSPGPSGPRRDARRPPAAVSPGRPFPFERRERPSAVSATPRNVQPRPQLL